MHDIPYGCQFIWDSNSQSFVLSCPTNQNNGNGGINIPGGGSGNGTISTEELLCQVNPAYCQSGNSSILGTVVGPGVGEDEGEDVKLDPKIWGKWGNSGWRDALAKLLLAVCIAALLEFLRHLLPNPLGPGSGPNNPRPVGGCSIPQGQNIFTTGQYIHGLVQAAFIAAHPTNGQINVRVYYPSGSYGIADAVATHSFPPRVEIHEIKPIRYAPPPRGLQRAFQSGKAQLHNYVQYYPVNPPTYAIEGTTWNPNGMQIPYPWNPNQNILLSTYYSVAPGMVYYECVP